MSDFISQKYGLDKSPEVLRSGGLQAYFERIDKVLHPKNKEGKLDEDKRERNIEFLRRRFHEKFVIKPEDIPESYWKHQEEMFRERGEWADYEKAPEKVKKETKHRLAETVVEDQRRSLDSWINYLVSEQAAYPDWFKYYAIREVLSTGSYNRETNQYSGRKPGTTAPFPELNQAALAKVLDRINAGNQSEKERTKGYKFSILYAEELRKLVPLDEKQLQETRGVWKTFKKGSDENKVAEALTKYNTGLCITGHATAKAYLQAGDLNIYFSMDGEGNPKIPRAALHVVEGNLQEVRGIAKNQNTDPYIADILAKKLKEFPNGEQYAKQSADMKRMTELMRKQEKHQPLTKEDLVFLYEIDSKIQGFGNKPDPRIDELRKQRDLKEDAPIVLECESNQIATSQKEITPNTKAYIGPLFPGIFKLNLENIFTRFPEGKIRNFELEIGEKTKDEYISAIDKAGMQITNWAKQLLSHKDFTTKRSTGSLMDKLRSKKAEPEKLDLVQFKVADLGFPQGATVKEIYEQAEKFGLELCPAEVGPAQRLKDAEQAMGDWYRIAMKPITDSVGNLNVFYVRRDSFGRFLDASFGPPDGRCNADLEWVFRRRK